MAEDEQATPHSRPVTFFDEISPDQLGMLEQSQSELAQEVARRTVQRFSPKTLKAALFPQHLGTMAQSDGYARTHGECGDLMTFYPLIKEKRIQKITFTTDGCDATIASGEMLASMASGLALDEAAQVTPNDLLAALDGLPPNHVHCAALAVKTLREAIENYREARNS